MERPTKIRLSQADCIALATLVKEKSQASNWINHPNISETVRDARESNPAGYWANPAMKDTPMIVLSSKEPVVKAEAFALGANDYLVNPYQPV
jgi:PleD family two-component response regulator